jgi:hypothetical protein
MCSDVFKYTESNPIQRQYIELKYVEQQSRQTAVAASATMSAVRRNGLSEVEM